MEEEMTAEPADCNDSKEREEEDSPPQLTVLTTVAYDYMDLPDPKSFDRMDIDNHNINFDDSNQVSSTTESTMFQQPVESVQPTLIEPEESAQIVEKADPRSPTEELQLPDKSDELSVPLHSPKIELDPPSKSNKLSVSPNSIRGKSRYGRVRKQKLSADFVSVDRKSFAVLNSNSYEPSLVDSPDVRPTPEKAKRKYRKKLEYVAESPSTNTKECADTSIISSTESVKMDDESSRSSLSMSTIKTYSRKGDIAPNTDEKVTISDDKETVVQINYPELNWKVGDIAWAKIGCYPYWPSIVTLEYGTSIYVKPVGKQQSRLAVHVHFFGDRGRRSWVLTTSLMKYESKEQFMEMKRRYVKDKLKMRYFVITPRIEDLWEKAVNEADTILKLPIDERTQYYQNLYPMTQEMYGNELDNSNIVKSSPKKSKNDVAKTGRKKKILTDNKSSDYVPKKKVKQENDSSDNPSIDLSKEKKREPVDEHTKKRRAFMRRMNQILKQSNAASLPPKKRIKLQASSEQVFNKLLDKTSSQKGQPQIDDSSASAPQNNCSSSSLDSKKNDLSVYDFESDDETDVFIGTYNSKFTPQILNKIEERVDAVEEKPKTSSSSKLPISLASSKPDTATSSKHPNEATPQELPPSDTTGTIIIKRKAGRPKGSKNKTKTESSSVSVVQELEKESVSTKVEIKPDPEPSINVPKEKSKRGRPPGSKVKTKLKKLEKPPLGMKNKIKSITALQHKQNKILLAAPPEVFKRPRGRPRKHPIVTEGDSGEPTKDSSSNGEVVPSTDTVVPGVKPKKRVTEKLKESVPDENGSVLTVDLSSEEEDAKSEEEKYSVAPFRSKKAFNIFLGVKNEKVCQICLKSGDTIRCRGPCCAYFHVECDAKNDMAENEAESRKPRRGRKRRSTAVSLVKVSNDDVDVGSSTQNTVHEDGSLNSEATPKKDTTENGDIPSETASNEEIPAKTSSSDDVRTVDLTDTEMIEADPVTSTNTMVNGNVKPGDETIANVEDETIPAKSINDEAAITAQESAENEISSSTGETSNGKANMKEKVMSIIVGESEETCLSDASAECNNVNVKTTNGNGVEFYCKRCSEDRLYPCFGCGKEIQDKTKETLRYTCYVVSCGRTYHKECLKEWPQASWGSSSSIKESLRCPQHYCHTCNSENPAVRNKHSNEILVRCIRCPTAYHKRVHCIPAGTEVLSNSQIICPRHYEPPGGLKHAHLNATWCFICCVGGSLICCDDCPMSFHVECLKLRPEEYEGRYRCDDCQTGRYILYGEIAWVKLGHYRWWPARVLFPHEIPENIMNIPHRRGEFVVQFFGSHDYNWVNRGRAFLYQEGDSGKKSCKRNSVDVSFEKAMAEAEQAYQELLLEKAARDEVTRMGLKPPRYVKIKANKPVGNVKIVEVDTSNITACECDPESEKPCAADSDCLNRMLLVECNPLVCKAGERCMNQVFEKRVYPPLVPYKTKKRGWGLKTLVDMKKGDFIIEYVGEMIDEDEFKRRVDIMHKKQEDNYYFLTIDNHRMLDAGPKGNVSRFMNHSCDPNCETQKWTVNGDTRIGLFAVKDIPANTELVFNYNLATQGNEKRQCLCGAINCSGFIGVKAPKNGNSSTDEESRKKSSDDTRKRSTAEVGSNATSNGVKKKRRTKKLKKMKLLRRMKPVTGKLAAAKLTTDLRMKMKMKNRAVLPPIKTTLETSGEKIQNETPTETVDTVATPQTSTVRFKNHNKLIRSPKRGRLRKKCCNSLLKSSTPVGAYSSPKSEELFRQKDNFRKDHLKSITNNENEPYVERRGRKKTPKNDDEKKELFFKILKRRIEQKIENMTVSEVDEKCFKCDTAGELLYCDNNNCPRGYHLPCVNRTRWPTGRWLCPWHYCIKCQSRCRIIKCDVCVNAYCLSHHKENIFEESEDKYMCKLHKSDKATQAYFKGVSMVRNTKNEDDELHDGTVQLPDMTENDSTNVKNLILLADVIEGTSKDANNSAISSSDVAEDATEDESKKVNTDNRKRKLSVQKVEPNISKKEEGTTTGISSKRPRKSSSALDDYEISIISKRSRKTSNVENDIKTALVKHRRISRTENETNAIVEKTKKVSETENECNISSVEGDTNVDEEKRRKSSRSMVVKKPIVTGKKKTSLPKNTTNAVVKKTKIISQNEKQTKVIVKKKLKSKNSNATNTIVTKHEKVSRIENETEAVDKRTKISRIENKAKVVIKSKLAPKTKDIKSPLERAKKISLTRDEEKATPDKSKLETTTPNAVGKSATSEKSKIQTTKIIAIGKVKKVSPTSDEGKASFEKNKLKTTTTILQETQKDETVEKTDAPSIVDKTNEAPPVKIKKISRTARKSMRNSTCTPNLLPSEEVHRSQTATKESDAPISDDEYVLVNEDPVQISDDEFVDLEVEVLNDSD